MRLRFMASPPFDDLCRYAIGNGNSGGVAPERPRIGAAGTRVDEIIARGRSAVDRDQTGCPAIRSLQIPAAGIS